MTPAPHESCSAILTRFHLTRPQEKFAFVQEGESSVRGHSRDPLPEARRLVLGICSTALSYHSELDTRKTKVTQSTAKELEHSERVDDRASCMQSLSVTLKARRETFTEQEHARTCEALAIVRAKKIVVLAASLPWNRRHQQAQRGRAQGFHSEELFAKRKDGRDGREGDSAVRNRSDLEAA